VRKLLLVLSYRREHKLCVDAQIIPTSGALSSGNTMSESGADDAGKSGVDVSRPRMGGYDPGAKTSAPPTHMGIGDRHDDQSTIFNAEEPVSQEQLQLIKARTMYQMVEEIDGGAALGKRKIIFLTNAQANLISTQPDGIKRLMQALEIPSPKLVINIISSWGFSGARCAKSLRLVCPRIDILKSQTFLEHVHIGRRAEQRIGTSVSCTFALHFSGSRMSVLPVKELTHSS